MALTVEIDTIPTRVVNTIHSAIGGRGRTVHRHARGEHAYGGFKAKLSRPGVTRAKFPLDTFVDRLWPRTRGPGKFALGGPHAPGAADLARLIPKNHGSPRDRAA
jgi:hypothetical protein